MKNKNDGARHKRYIENCIDPNQRGGANIKNDTQGRKNPNEQNTEREHIYIFFVFLHPGIVLEIHAQINTFDVMPQINRLCIVGLYLY